MNHNSSERSSNIPQPSEAFGRVTNHAEEFRTVPNPSEDFRNVPNHAEPFGTIPQSSEEFRTARKESHTLTVRDTARMFELAGVARTERSIVNWCQPNATGIARLDAYFDPNERRYYITEQSIQNAIVEEKAKAFRNRQNVSDSLPNASEAPNEAQPSKQTAAGSSEPKGSSVERELFDLRILNAGKDYLIEQLREERDSMLKQLTDGSKRIGELETRLLMIGDASHKTREITEIPKNSEESQEAFGI